ncbi:hypothetical protein [Nocardia jejuensis]|uniref:hypothetical protein n=1 Tax=Nocardia jejuensis TaxID=328049 RepID=UPI00082FB2DA|nr:hypothetical protein [Nocardia jejuensis]
MHKEHEEAMRSDFSDRFGESLKALWPGLSTIEVTEIDRRVSEYDHRWTEGPYAMEWEFLHACYRDWRDRPVEMRVFAEDVRAYPGVYTANGLTEVARRSIDQADNVAREEQSAIRALRPAPERLPISRER